MRRRASVAVYFPFFEINSRVARSPRLLIGSARRPKLFVQLSRVFDVPPKQFWPAVSIRTLYETNTLHERIFIMYPRRLLGRISNWHNMYAILK
jgi:hypothetical protein